ncbi:MAG: methyltransferase domain-containing protein [Hyphomicrobiaceae bacterium]|nr:methyltransferase domain-containing protein [Hyphomicrobiaceae bacterium]
MHHDVIELRDFYTTPLGHVVRRTLQRQIRRYWPVVKGDTLVGLGFAPPYLAGFRREAGRIAALMPAGQGALVWPRDGGVLAALAEEDKLPVPDASVDKLLAIHCLENADHVRPMLREIWRVLAPQGSLIIVVPNRRGLWARLDNTPFGQGQPYSRLQLSRLLEESLLTPVQCTGALFVPPFERRMVIRSAGALERLGGRLTPGFAGVVIVEAKKEVVATIGKVARAPVVGEIAVAKGR